MIVHCPHVSVALRRETLKSYTDYPLFYFRLFYYSDQNSSLIGEATFDSIPCVESSFFSKVTVRFVPYLCRKDHIKGEKRSL